MALFEEHICCFAGGGVAASVASLTLDVFFDRETRTAETFEKGNGLHFPLTARRAGLSLSVKWGTDFFFSDCEERRIKKRSDEVSGRFL